MKARSYLFGCALLFLLGSISTSRAQTLFSFDTTGNLASQAASAGAVTPVITAQPTATLGQVGGTYNFSVVAAGTGLTYQWYENNAPINGATGSTLLITNAQSGNFTNHSTGANSYDVVVTNTAGSITSNTVALDLDTDNTGMPDWWQIQYFGSIGISPGEDADGDGVANLQEYLDGTNPTDATSHDYTLAVSGPVTVQPSLTRFPPGTTVTLTATSSPDGYFECWTGNVTGTSPTQTIVMNSNMTATAVISTEITPATAPVLSAGGPQGQVNCLLLESNDQFYVGGRYQTLNGRPQWDLGRFNANSSLDTTYFAGAGIELPNSSNGVTAMAQQSDGKIIVAGFTAVANNNFAPYTSIYRINTDGTIDTTFAASAATYIEDSGSQANINDVTVLPSGQILIAGDFTTVNGVVEGGIARLNADGSLDTTFNSGGAGLGTANAFADVATLCLQVDANGLIYIAGDFNSYDGVSEPGLARLTANGSLDTTFNAGSDFDGNSASFGAILVRPGHGILVGGSFDDSSGNYLGSLLALKTDGTVDSSFNVDPNVYAQCFTLLSNGQILAGGNGTITRLNTNGTTDAAFASPYFGGSGILNSIVVQSNGDVVAAGDFSSVNGVAQENIARLTSSGTLDTTAITNTGVADQGPEVGCLAEEPDGKVLVGGGYALLDNSDVNFLARLNADSSLDATFNSGGVGPDSTVATIVAIPDGKIFIGGYFSHYNNSSVRAYARLNADGTLDATFASGVLGEDSAAVAAVIQSDGKIIVGGEFQQNTVYLKRLNSDGTVDTTFSANLDNQVICEALQADGKLLVGGYFQTIGGVAAPHLARLNTDGSLDTSFTAPAGIAAAQEEVTSIAVLPSGQILVSAANNAVQRLNANGTVDTSYVNLVSTSAIFPNGITSLVALPDGSAIVGGEFIYTGAPPPTYFLGANGQVTQYMVKLLPNGVIDPSFNPGVNAAPQVLLARSNGDIYAGGEFSTDAVQNAVGLVRYSAAPNLLLGLVSVSPTSPVAPGTAETLTATASSTSTTMEDVFFQVSTDGVNFSNIAQATTLGNNEWTTQWTPSAAGTYYLRTLATDDSQVTGESVAVSNFMVNAAGAAPQITSQPQSQSVALGGSAIFSVTATGGGLSYQWQYDGTPLAGQISSTLALSNLTLPQSGNYSVVVSNSIGSLPSSTAVLSVQASISQWAAAYGVSTSYSATPQNDGVPNLLKYAFAINPTRAMTPTDDAALPHVGTTISNSQEYLVLTYRQYSAAVANGVLPVLQISTDLQSWSDVPQNEIFSQPMPPDQTTGDQVMQIGIQVDGTSKQFIRLQVTGP